MHESDDEQSRIPVEAPTDRRTDSLVDGVWHAPRGPKTRIVSIVIVTAIGICLVATAAVVLWSWLTA